LGREALSASLDFLVSVSLRLNTCSGIVFRGGRELSLTSKDTPSYFTPERLSIFSFDALELRIWFESARFSARISALDSFKTWGFVLTSSLVL